MGPGCVAPEVARLEFPSGGYWVQRVPTDKVKVVLPVLDARSLTALALSVEDGIQRFHFQTTIAS